MLNNFDEFDLDIQKVKNDDIELFSSDGSEWGNGGGGGCITAYCPSNVRTC